MRLRSSLLGLVFCCFLAPLEGNALEQPAAPPNIVLIISDDQAYTDYSFMGHPAIKTPHIDRLAEQSLTFKRGYVPNSLCRPSLLSIVTGLYPHQHGVVGNDPPVPEHLASLPKRQLYPHPEYIVIRNQYIGHVDANPCLPKLLQKKGYLSHQSGKWWEGHHTRGGFTHGMTHGDRTRGGRHGDLGLTIGRQGLQPVKDFVQHAVAEEKPFMLFYAPFLPHTPHNPPERLLAKYRDQTPHLPVAKYWAMCDWFDETVGELVGYIEEQGLASNTIFVYVTDNGWINDLQESRYAPKSKRSQYDGGLRTPIMIRWDGKVEPKMNATDLAISLDIVPTLLHAVGLKQEILPAMQGINLLEQQAVAGRDTLYGEILEHDIVHMTDAAASLQYRWVINKDWKLIVPNPGRLPESLPELYNLTEDPQEETNLVAQHPEKVQELTTLLNAWWPPEDRR